MSLQKIDTDYKKQPPRFVVVLSGVDYYVYNKVEEFEKLERRYNNAIERMLSEGLGPDPEADDTPPTKDGARGLSNDAIRKGYMLWRQLISTIDLEIFQIRVLYGNGNAPSLFALFCDNVKMRYTVTVASTAVDPLMHVMDGALRHFRIGFLPSPDYADVIPDVNSCEEMLACDRLSFHHYMDQAAESAESISDLEAAASPLMSWGLEIMLSKRATLRYGPWADEQRDLIYRSVFPVQRLPITPSSLFERQFESFNIRIKTEDTLEIQLRFRHDRQDEQANEFVAFECQQASYVEIRVPWIIGPAGFTSTIACHLEQFHSRTSLQWQRFVEADVLDATIEMHYPLVWNAPQIWEIQLDFRRTTLFFFFQHKDFFSQLFDDWSSRHYQDILRFVPMTMKYRIRMHDFELIAFVNEHNWVDCSPDGTENVCLAFCGVKADVKLTLPMDEFMPETLLSQLNMTAERTDLKIRVPESNTHHHGLLMLNRSAIIRSRLDDRQCVSGLSDWRRYTDDDDVWLKCWSAGAASIDVSYRYHLLPELKHGHRLKGPEKGSWRQRLRQLEPDEIVAEITVTRSKVFLTGAFLRYIYIFKQNYFGADQYFVSLQDSGLQQMSAEQLWRNIASSQESHTSRVEVSVGESGSDPSAADGFTLAQVSTEEFT